MTADSSNSPNLAESINVGNTIQQDGGMLYRLMDEIKRAVITPAGGPTPLFSLPHVVKAIIMIGDSKGIGRKKIAEIMEIGEGTARTMIQRLQEIGLIEVDRRGCHLTEKGNAIYSKLKEAISGPLPIDIKGVWGFEFNVGLMVKGAGDVVKLGIEQRDAAIKHDARGAMTIVQRGGRLIMPGVSDLSVEYPEFAKVIEKTFRPGDGDVIIIVGADEEKKAELGAIAAAMVTLGVDD